MSEDSSAALRRADAGKRRIAWLLVLALLAGAMAWSWRQPFMSRPRTLCELSWMSPPISLPVPVRGVEPRRIADTFGAPRGRDRSHAGVDIFATRGTPISSTTRGVVLSIREGGLGGKQVWIFGPARQRHYYAHMDRWAEGLRIGQVVNAGDILGFVGDTGNARGTPPHLHYGIYGDAGAYDPLPLLRGRMMRGANPQPKR